MRAIRLIKRILLFAAVLTAFSMLFVIQASAITDDGRIVVVLDPGHGGTETGGCSGTYREHYYNMKVANYCKEALDRTGKFKTILSHPDNEHTVSLLERALVANEANADIVLSIHFDDNLSQSQTGVSAYVSVVEKYQKMSLAEDILRRLDEKTGLGVYWKGVQAIPDRGDTLYYWSDEYNWSFPDDPSVGPLRDYYGILKWDAYFGIPAIIVEHGFLSCPRDRNIIDGHEEIYKALGEGDAEALIEYFTNHEHKFGAETRDFPSNCVLNGKMSEHCSVCCARRNVRTLALGDHFYRESARADVTCENDGYVCWECEYTRAMNVGKEGFIQTHIKEETTPALGHNYSLIISEDPAHGKDGRKVYRCSNCGNEYTEVVPGENHTFVERGRVDPDCENDGYILYTCSVCGIDKKEVTVKAYGHTYEKSATFEPDCENSGYDIFVCSVCGYEKRDIIPAKGHDFTLGSVSDTGCSAPLTAIGWCSVCGKELTQKLDGFGEHRPGEIDSEDGSFVCAVCGEKVTQKRSGEVVQVSLEPGKSVPPDTSDRNEPSGNSDAKDGKPPKEKDDGNSEFYPLPPLDHRILFAGEIALIFAVFLTMIFVLKLKRKKTEE